MKKLVHPKTKLTVVYNASFSAEVDAETHSRILQSFMAMAEMYGNFLVSNDVNEAGRSDGLSVVVSSRGSDQNVEWEGAKEFPNRFN